MKLLRVFLASVPGATVSAAVVSRDSVSAASVPPPGIEEKKLGILIGMTENPFVAGRATIASGARATWDAKWILDGHLLTLTAAHGPALPVDNALYVLGYSARAKRHWMLVVRAGETADSVDVRWFTIDGDLWRFAPTVERVGGTVLQRQVIWNSHTRAAPTTIMPSASEIARWPTLPLTPEMAPLVAWTGTWPNRHNEPGLGGYVDGMFVSKPIAEGHFVGWFETNVLRKTTGQSVSGRETSIWGYSESARLFFRLDIETSNGGRTAAPNVDGKYAKWWFAARGNAVVVVAPLESKAIGKDTVQSRFGFVLSAPRVMTVFEEHLQRNGTWIDAPAGHLTWREIGGSTRREGVVRAALDSAYSAWSAAEQRKDLHAYMSYIAPGFTAVGQAGNTFDRVQLEGFARDNTTSADFVSQAYEIEELHVVGDKATVSVRHFVTARLHTDTLNGRKLKSQPVHVMVVQDVMDQTWIKVGRDWKVKHWTDITGNIWVDGALSESWPAAAGARKK